MESGKFQGGGNTRSCAHCGEEPAAACGLVCELCRANVPTSDTFIGSTIAATIRELERLHQEVQPLSGPLAEALRSARAAWDSQQARASELAVLEQEVDRFDELTAVFNEIEAWLRGGVSRAIELTSIGVRFGGAGEDDRTMVLVDRQLLPALERGIKKLQERAGQSGRLEGLNHA